MKKYILIVIASLLLFACDQAELEKSRMELGIANQVRDSILSVQDSLMKIIDERETTLNEFITTFNEVEHNLDSVAIKQHIIYLNSVQSAGELKANQKERIKASIETINNLMDENRKKITELTAKLRNSSHKNIQFENILAALNNQLSQKDIELKALNEKLSAINSEVVQLKTSVDTLTVQNIAKSKTIAEETIIMHTAYYIVGKTKYLEDAKLIDKKGGLLGIGKTTKLNENFNKKRFKRIDYTQTTNIPINSDDVKIITSHPPDSYKFDRENENYKMITNLLIINPEKFWSVSKYLVVTKD